MTKMSIKQQEEIIEKEVVDQLVVKKNGDIQWGEGEVYVYRDTSGQLASYYGWNCRENVKDENEL